MRAWWRRQSLKTRLAIWYAGTMLATLAVLAPAVFVLIEQRLHAVFDRQMSVDLSLLEASLVKTEDGVVRHLGQGDPAREGSGTRFAWFEVWTTGGELLLRSRPKGRAEAPSPLAPPRQGGARSYSARLEGGDEVRILEREASHPREDLVLRAYRDEAGVHRTLRQILVGFALSAPFAAFLAAAGGFALARRALAPVAAMAEEARRITSESLGTRFSQAASPDELGQLATVFNATLGRLERSFTELDRFTGDAAHELRTPLTALKTVGEIGLRESHDADELRMVIASMLEEGTKLDAILEDLLVLARGQGVRGGPGFADVEANALLAEARDRLEVLAEERGQSISLRCEPALVVRGDRHLLLLALTNLLHNAIRHGRAGGRIDLEARGEEGRVVLEVRDDGPGIAPEHHSRIFERFYRVDRGRGREHGGTGLGLAIARLFVEQHDGTIEVDSEAGRGCTLRVVLPRDGTAPA